MRTIRFATNLTTLRKQKGYTQETISEKMGVSRQAFAKWENGESVPDIYRITELAEEFGITVDELLYSENIPPTTPNCDITLLTSTINMQRQIVELQARLAELEFADDESDDAADEAPEYEDEDEEQAEEQLRRNYYPVWEKGETDYDAYAYEFFEEKARNAGDFGFTVYFAEQQLIRGRYDKGFDICTKFSEYLWDEYNRIGSKKELFEAASVMADILIGEFRCMKDLFIELADHPEWAECFMFGECTQEYLEYREEKYADIEPSSMTDEMYSLLFEKLDAIKEIPDRFKRPETNEDEAKDADTCQDPDETSNNM